MVSFMQWSIGEVSGHAEADPEIADDAPMPRWSWEGLQA
jgi:hypothetical protein